jgi:hypothetical protein
MTETELDLARKLAAHHEWEWLGGMLVEADGDERTWRLVGGGWVQEAGESQRPRPGTWYPDLADPATQGCLIAMLTPYLDDIDQRGQLYDGSCGTWVVGYQKHSASLATITTGCDTLGEALATALLDAWDHDEGEP